MLFFLVSCLSFLLLSHMKSRVWKFPCILREFLVLQNHKTKMFFRNPQIPTISPPPQNKSTPRFDFSQEEHHKMSLLDLPDLALDCILEKLPPAELCSMAAVCSSMREKCASDHLWERLMREKWGDVIGEAAYREWQSQLAAKRAPRFLHFAARRNGFGPFSGLLGVFGLKSEKVEKRRSCLPVNSVMSCYLALESGKFWFPAQVFNRENGHVGFMLSCYDAQLSYGSTTDNFVARYKAQGRSMIEEGIEWKRIRAPSVDTPADALHISDCLDQLSPNDHIEIQWRKNKAFPYGWWYGVVGHLDSCTRNQFTCHCHTADTVVLEFKQYTPGSRWRNAIINRKEHSEIGNEADGFYGGIRKLNKKEEIEKWKQLWPICTLE